MELLRRLDPSGLLCPPYSHVLLGGSKLILPRPPVREPTLEYLAWKARKQAEYENRRYEQVQTPFLP